MRKYCATSDGEVLVFQGKKKRALVQPPGPIADMPFGWGITGPSANALAYALLCDALGDRARAVKLYMRFKYRVIQGLKRDMGWTLTHSEILKTVDEIEQTEKLMQRERQRVEPPPLQYNDRGPGIVWDVEYKGSKE
jgi:hypothetical protein